MNFNLDINLEYSLSLLSIFLIILFIYSLLRHLFIYFKKRKTLIIENLIKNAQSNDDSLNEIITEPVEVKERIEEQGLQTDSELRTKLLKVGFKKEQIEKLILSVKKKD